jgi:nucleoside transporter
MPSQFSVMVRLSLMMFLQFFVWGAWYVTAGNYMTSHDMGSIIGWAYSVAPIAAIVSPFFLGMVADRYFPSERVLGVLHILGGLAMFAVPMYGEGAQASHLLFILALLVHALCYMPTLGLTNTIAFNHLTSQEKQFPIVRVFGTIGWIVANTIVSKIYQADTAALQFNLAGGAGVLLGVYSFFLPHTPPPAAGKKATVGQILGLDSLRLLKEPSFAVFIFSSFLICAPLAAYYAYAPVFIAAAGGENPAYLMSFGQWAEIVFMLVMPLCFAFLGVKWMLLIGMLAWVVRYGLFAVGAPDSVWWMIMGGVLLHGICYDFFFVTGFIYVDKKAPPEVRGQAQGLLVLVTQGLGMLLGAQIFQLLFNRGITGEGADLGQWQQFWYIPCAAAAVIMIIFAVMFRDDTRSDSKIDGGTG